jgi:RNA polymerase sigma factor (TIGR02999 family)
MVDSTDITNLLRAAGSDATAMERLYAVVYDELRGVARNQLRAERADHTLQATALANEVYLKLLGQTKDDWQNRAQFFAVAARATRRVLVDHARARLRAKRGGGAHHTAMGTHVDPAAPGPDERLVALDEALSRLKEEDPVKCQVVEMRHFAGFTNEEIARALDVSTRTVERHWRFAKAWLYRALSEEETGE